MKQYLLMGLIFLIGLGLGFAGQWLIKGQTNQEVRNHQTQYNLINPLLECESAAFKNADGLSDLESKLNAMIDDAVARGEVTQVSVYYRDLNNGPWIGIEENEDFAPASLIKVPVMIALYKLAESDPTILSRSVTIPPSVEYTDVNIVPEATLSAGQTLTVSELLERMIVESDNNAYDLLLPVVGQAQLERIYTDLGLSRVLDQNEEGENNIITVKDYAGFFRVLYNSSYLSQDHSQQALALLANVEYRDGLVGGVPAEVKIAHKFGERNFTFSGLKQLHDCGIVYAKTNPYLLCVMTKGDDFESLQEIIQDVSKTVYQNQSEQ